MRAAIYTRVSGRSNRQETENQAIVLREYCQRQGWEFVEFTDRMTGTRADRDGLIRLFDAASRREFDICLFWSLDRFSRGGTIQTLEMLQRLTNWGVQWRSHQEAFLDSTGPMRDAVVGLLAALAKMEHGRLSERIIAGQQRARRHGTRSGKPIGGQRKIVDRERIRTLHASGLSVRAIAAQLGVSKSLVALYCRKR
jgi:DNA invertase Pin-like site-specific DNA recombinase